MRCLPIVIMFMVLAACNAAPNPAKADSGDVGGQERQVTFDIRSWGKLVSHWRISTDGTGEIWRVAEGGTMIQYDIRKFRLRIDAATLARFSLTSGALKQATRSPIACKLQITDMQYGNIVWTDGGEPQTFNFNYGCRSQPMDRAFDMIQQANEIVSKQAVIEPEPFAIEHIGRR